MAAIVGDVNGRPGRPGRGLLQVGARERVARLVLLQEGGGRDTGFVITRQDWKLRFQAFCLRLNLFLLIYGTNSKRA